MLTYVYINSAIFASQKSAYKWAVKRLKLVARALQINIQCNFGKYVSVIDCDSYEMHSFSQHWSQIEILLPKARWSLLSQCVAAGLIRSHKPRLNSLVARILQISGAQMNLDELTSDFIKIALTRAQISISIPKAYVHENSTRCRKPDTSENQMTIVAWPRYYSLSPWQVSCIEIA
jgi:hypothetical protein